ncbi:unnamed protein product, partial [Phaeothamnion confervicola]
PPAAGGLHPSIKTGAFRPRAGPYRADCFRLAGPDGCARHGLHPRRRAMMRRGCRRMPCLADGSCCRPIAAAASRPSGCSKKRRLAGR